MSRQAPKHRHKRQHKGGGQSRQHTPEYGTQPTQLPRATPDRVATHRVGPPHGKRGLAIAVLIILLAVSAPALVRQARRLFIGIEGSPAGLVFVRGKSLVEAGGGPGKERVLVTMPGEGRLGNPAVSPDGNRLVFTYSQGEYGTGDWGSDLHMLELPARGKAGVHSRVLLRHGKPGDAVESASWSPDGRSMLITYQEALYEGQYYQGRRSLLQRLELETSRRETIAPDAGDPSWSPDGKQIAYIRTDPQRRQSLWVAQPDGSQPRQIAGSPEYVAMGGPRYSPDGRRLLFAASPGTAARTGESERASSWLGRLGPASAEAHGMPWDVWLWEDGRAPTRLTRLGEDLLSVAWAPTGDTIGIVTDLGLYTLRPNGADLKRIEIAAEPGGLAWLES